MFAFPSDDTPDDMPKVTPLRKPELVPGALHLVRTLSDRTFMFYDRGANQRACVHLETPSSTSISIVYLAWYI